MRGSFVKKGQAKNQGGSYLILSCSWVPRQALRPNAPLPCAWNLGPDAGTRPGLHGQTLMSMGLVDFDRLLGGGLPLGTLTLLLEVRFCQLARVSERCTTKPMHNAMQILMDVASMSVLIRRESISRHDFTRDRHSPLGTSGTHTFVCRISTHSNIEISCGTSLLRL